MLETTLSFVTYSISSVHARINSCVEAGINTSTVAALRVAGGNRKGVQCLGV
jgi:hypothetical protein